MDRGYCGKILRVDLSREKIGEVIRIPFFRAGVYVIRPSVSGETQPYDMVEVTRCLKLRFPFEAAFCFSKIRRSGPTEEGKPLDTRGRHEANYLNLEHTLRIFLI